MTICGVSLVAILSSAVMAIGAYNIAKFAVSKIRTLKREKARRKAVDNKVEAAVDYAAGVYNHLKDPAVREATVRDIAGEVYVTLKAGDLPLADQFKSRTKIEQEVKQS